MLAPRPGFEPGFKDSKSFVLPLDDPGTARVGTNPLIQGYNALQSRAVMPADNLARGHRVVTPGYARLTGRAPTVARPAYDHHICGRSLIRVFDAALPDILNHDDDPRYANCGEVGDVPD